MPSCQTIMWVRASRGAVGTGSDDGMSWWWNHAAPGATHAMRAGNMVDTSSPRLRRCSTGTEEALTGFDVEEEELVEPAQG